LVLVEIVCYVETDAVGVEVVNKLRGKTGGNKLLITAGNTSEIYTDVITNFKPTHILFVSTARFNKETVFKNSLM